MMERNSEGKMVWAVIAIIGMQFLGIDIKEIVAMLSDMQQQAETIQVKSNGLFSGDIALPALVGIYAWGRTKLKQTREQSGAEKVEKCGKLES